MAIYVKRYNGSAWVDAVVKRYNGSSWVDALVKKWNGSSWVQIYPETVATGDKTLSASGSTLNTYRSKWDSDSVAKQGVYSSYAAAHGYLGVKSTSLTGCGNITAISSAKFSGTRDGSGSYNSNQTLYFYRSNVAPATTSPSGTLTGSFTSTTGGPGSGGSMSNRTVTVNTNTLNWANNVSSKPNLYIYSKATGDYAGIKTSFSLALKYTYSAKTLSFNSLDEAGVQASAYVYRQVKGSTPYYSLTVYEDEKDLTLREIIQRREDGLVEDIARDSVIENPETKVWTREYKIEEDNTFKVEVFNMKWDEEAQYSLDGETWEVLYGLNQNSNYLSAKLPEDFNKYRDFIYVRIIDKKKEIIQVELTVDPIIYVPGQQGIYIADGNEDLDALFKK